MRLSDSARAAFAIALIWALVVTIASCGTPRTELVVKPFPDRRTTLTRAEIGETHATRNLYDALQSLRGNWLNQRGVDSFILPHGTAVWVDGQLYGGLRELRGIRASDVERVEHYSGAEVPPQYGGTRSNGGAVILVTTRNGR